MTWPSDYEYHVGPPLGHGPPTPPDLVEEQRARNYDRLVPWALGVGGEKRAAHYRLYADGARREAAKIRSREERLRVAGRMRELGCSMIGAYR